MDEAAKQETNEKATRRWKIGIGVAVAGLLFTGVNAFIEYSVAGSHQAAAQNITVKLPSGQVFHCDARSDFDRRYAMISRKNLRFIALALAFLLVNAGISFGINRAVTDGPISQLQADAATAAAESAQQADIFNTVLVHFFAEENFICEELVAHNKVLGGPVPPAGICDVSLTPSP